MHTKPSGGFVITIVLQVTELELPDCEFDLFKPEKEKLFVLISITLNADSIAPKVSFELVSCVNV